MNNEQVNTLTYDENFKLNTTLHLKWDMLVIKLNNKNDFCPKLLIIYQNNLEPFLSGARRYMVFLITLDLFKLLLAYSACKFVLNYIHTCHVLSIYRYG